MYYPASHSCTPSLCTAWRSCPALYVRHDRRAAEPKPYWWGKQAKIPLEYEGCIPKIIQRLKQKISSFFKWVFITIFQLEILSKGQVKMEDNLNLIPNYSYKIWLHHLCLEVKQWIVMSCVCFGPRHFPY